MKRRVRVPCLGEIVIVGTTEKHNGSNQQPAIVNRVWNEGCVNVMVMPDAGTPFAMTSVSRFTPSSEENTEVPIQQFDFPETNRWKAYDDGVEEPPEGQEA